MIRDLTARLSDAGIVLCDVRLNGSAASYVIHDWTVGDLKVRSAHMRGLAVWCNTY
jgi:hypothetical protein